MQAYSSHHINPNGGNSPLIAPSGDLAQAQAHLGWWFGPALSDPGIGAPQIVLATLSGKRSPIAFQPFDSTAEAAQWAVEQSARTNVYTHLALHGPNRPKGKGSVESALCLPGVAVDLDAQCSFRGSNEGKAPDVASLRLIIADFQVHYHFPLTIIESGYGVYPLVRFREPLWLDDMRAREEADSFLARFGESFRVFARKRGWPSTVDRVGLAGLLRVAGTYNRKGNTPLLVRFAEPGVPR
jgi:hypothetical protein